MKNGSKMEHTNGIQIKTTSIQYSLTTNNETHTLSLFSPLLRANVFFVVSVSILTL